MGDVVSAKGRREVYWDLVKGVTIVLVIIGHSIQYSCGGEQGFIDNPVFKFIYSFHMPLFMLVSGYFFCFSTERHSAKEIIISRLRQCILPIITITIILQFVRLDFSPVNAFHQFTSSYWFLWVLFFLSCLVLIVKRFHVGISIVLYFFIYLCLFFLPDAWILRYFAFMYPFFIVGFFLNKSSLIDIFFKDYLVPTTLIMGLFFLILYAGYGKETYIYFSHYSILKGGGLHQIVVDLHRMLIGFCGSFFILGIMRLIYQNYLINESQLHYVISYMGMNTLQLYLISRIPVFDRIEMLFSNGTVNYCLATITTLLVMTLSIIAIESIKKVALLNYLFFGKR